MRRCCACLQKDTWSATLALAYRSVGIIYGDIGTSPLYVYASTFTSSPSQDDVVVSHFHDSLITRFPIRRSGASQQTFYGSPPACPVLGFLPPCV